MMDFLQEREWGLMILDGENHVHVCDCMGSCDRSCDPCMESRVRGHDTVTLCRGANLPSGQIQKNAIR